MWPGHVALSRRCARRKGLLRQPNCRSPVNALTPPHATGHRTRARRPLGVRLRLADLAAGLRLSRKPARAADRRAPGAMRVLARPSRHAGAAGPRARARSRRRLPRRRLPGGEEKARRGDRVSARTRAGHQRLSRGDAERHPARRQGTARLGALLHDRPRARAICRAARPRDAASSGAAGTRPVRPEPRIRALNRAGAGEARALRSRSASAGREAEGRARNGHV